MTATLHAQTLLVFLLTLTLTIHIVNGDCKGKADGYYPDPDSDNGFYQCTHGIEYELSCPEGLVFDPELSVCNWPQNNQNRPNADNSDETPVPTPVPTPVETEDNLNNSSSPMSPEPTGTQCARRVCYYTNWAQYRPTKNTKYLPTNIDPFMCTHIVYAFAKFEGTRIAPFEWNDESTEWSVGNFEKTMNLKKRNPALKVLLAIGGWNMGSDPFHRVVATSNLRKEFVSNAIKFLRSHKFDGLDLDWEYPANRGSPPGDKYKFTYLVRDLRNAFDQEASGNDRLLLTAAVGAGKSTIDTAYEIPDISQELDFINLMTYDLHGGWEIVTGHHSGLYPSTIDRDDNAYLNVHWAVKYWLQQGAPKHKLVVGMPLYGRSFTLTSPANELQSPAITGKSGKYTREKGYLAYYEICELIAKGGKEHFLSDQRSPYLVAGDQWVGYDNESSLREKVRYVRDLQLGGVMVWSLDLDDFSGDFCGKGVNPLLTAIKDECNN